jgi:feruloyl esterase
MRILEPNLRLPTVARTHRWFTLVSATALLAACGGGESGSADTAAAAQQKSAALPIASIVQTTTCEGLLTATVESAQVTAAVLVPATPITGPDGTTSILPPYCKVRAVATPVPGSAIDIEVRLPSAENWNGRFQGLGNSAFGGTGTVDLAMNGTGNTAVAAGFAVATTDMGTTPAIFLDGDALIGQPQKWIDWGSRATHLMTTVSKSLISAYYGRGPKWSYFQGCSTGGQQGMMSAQRYPEDYDGILAGAPAANRTHLHTQFVWNYNALTATPNSRFTAASAQLLQDAAVKACAVKTGGIAGHRGR